MLGAKQVICSAWTDVRNDRIFIVEKFQEICDLARPFGMTVNLEFPAFSRLASLDDCIEILELSQARNQGLLVDTLYMHFDKMPLFALERVPAEWINFMHICDADDVAYTRNQMIHVAREARLYPGEGAIDFSAINYLFPHLPLAIELPNAERTATYGHQEHARRCLIAARTYLDQEPGLKKPGSSIRT
jgi:sugar phosphate isomerase/epimerase